MLYEIGSYNEKSKAIIAKGVRILSEESGSLGIRNVVLSLSRSLVLEVLNATRPDEKSEISRCSVDSCWVFAQFVINKVKNLQ